MSKSKVLFQLSGSIACFKAADAISKLVQEGFEVQTVCTPSATKFIGKATLEGLTGRPVLQDMFEKGQAMSHIDLARESDLLVLCPATANTINKLAAGFSDDLVGSLFLANNFKKPYWIFPAMNVEMLEHPATKDSLEKLRSWGSKVFETDDGNLACGEKGKGRLLSSEKIVEHVKSYFEVPL